MGATPVGGIALSSADNLSELPPEVVPIALEAFTRAFDDVFLIAVPFILVGFIAALFLKETPLRHHTQEIAKADVAGT